MGESYELSRLDANSFEHLVNLLALQVLGSGHTGFGPGPDAGRDGYFHGEAPYPSISDRWRGVWYIQAKFHKPHLSADPQKWLVDRIKEEVQEFSKPQSRRQWPDNWIVATNIDPSGASMTGAFDRARDIVSRANSRLKNRFHIWGGRKIIDLLTLYPKVASAYRHFLTPGHVLASLYERVKDASAEIDSIVRFLIVRQFEAQQYTRLEQAGSDADTRPGIHRLFIDLPFKAGGYEVSGKILSNLVKASAWCQRSHLGSLDTPEWRHWRHHPSRARVWFVKGGPGQGKSTVGQYFCQIQRAALILQESGPAVTPNVRSLAREVYESASRAGLWPQLPRIPVTVELKDFAYWYGNRSPESGRGILTYLAERIKVAVEQEVLTGTLKRVLGSREWFILFDGLDEVPQDVKDKVALEVRHFLDDVALEVESDLLALCTSRPQGYSGQFDTLDGPTLELVALSPVQALECARPVVALNRNEDEERKASSILASAIQSESVSELMTTPLQAHIMAVVIRDGGRPPERRWQLYANFYQVIRRREANRDLPDERLSKLLREEEHLLKAVHNRLGFVLHSRAETSKGAVAHLEREEFRELVRQAVSQMKEEGVELTVDVVMEATTNRLVLVSTPDDGNHVRFDIRPLQEFFAAEFIYGSVDANALAERLSIIAGDSHWREVMHFLLSALIENRRFTEMAVAISAIVELNDEGVDHGRVLSRRLGLGALLAARLLQEGVLEQDKRMRQQFSRCIEPITAFSPMGRGGLSLIASVSQSNSRSWLIKFLVDRLREASWGENIGAAVVLGWILPDEHEAVELVIEKISSAPPDYLALVLKAMAPRRWDRDEPRLKKWSYRLALEALLREDWLSLPDEGVRGALDILSSSKRLARDAARHRGLSEVCIEVVGLISDRSKSEKKPQVEDYGVVRIEWLEELGGSRAWRRMQNGFSENDPGFLSFLGDLAHHRFGQLGQSHAVEVLRILDERPGTRFGLPGSLQIASVFDVLCDHEPQSEKLGGLKLPWGAARSVLSIEESTSFSLEGWRRLLGSHPLLALDLWGGEGPWGGRIQGRLEASDSTELVVSLLVARPELLRRIPSLWGKLLNRAQEGQKEVLRRAILDASSGEPKSNRNSMLIEPFCLRMPKESMMLPHLIQPISRMLTNGVSLAEVRRLVGAFVPKSSDLELILDDQEGIAAIKAASIIMFWLHPRRRKNISGRIAQIVELWAGGTGIWFQEGVVRCIVTMSSGEDVLMRQLVGRLLEEGREDFLGRRELEDILSVWRENSVAPVQSAGVESKWLNLG